MSSLADDYDAELRMLERNYTGLSQLNPCSPLLSHLIIEGDTIYWGPEFWNTYSLGENEPNIYAYARLNEDMRSEIQKSRERRN